MKILDDILLHVLYGEHKDADEKLKKVKPEESWVQGLCNIYRLFIEKKLEKCREALNELNEKVKNSELRTRLFCIKQVLNASLEFLLNDFKAGQRYLNDIQDHGEYSEIIAKLGKHQKIPLIRDALPNKTCDQEKEEFVSKYREGSEITAFSTWFVVEANWFAIWMNKVGFNKEQEYFDLPFIHMTAKSSNEQLLKITNSLILESKSSDELNSNNKFAKPLKPGLQEFTDYVLLPQRAFEFLNSKYGTDEIVPRPCYENKDGSFSIEVYLKKIEVVLGSKKKLRKKTHLVSRFEKLKNIVKLIYKALGEKQTDHFKSQTKIWKINSEIIEQQKLERLIKAENNEFFDGCKRLDLEESIEGSEISNSDYLFFDIAIDQTSFIINNSSSNCSLCKTDQRVIDCKCKKSLCEKCIKKHRNQNNSCKKKPKRKFSLFSCFCKQAKSYSFEVNHIRTQARHPKIIQGSSDSQHSLSVSQEVQKKAKAQELEETSSTLTQTNTGISLNPVGLQNLGNTCFMNSAVQCLAYCEPLSWFLLSAELKGKINKTNPLGTKGKLVVAYSDLLRLILGGKEKSLAPWDLKKTISSVASQFEGYQQHDSHEFLSYLIAGLHEDLNQVKKKPYENTEIKYVNDEVTANESWNRFLSRNQSFIVDLMYGQYKSTVVCPRCQKESITFDPFSSITLPIPVSSGKTFEVSLVKYDWTESLAKVTVSATSKTNMLEVKEQLKTVAGLAVEQVKIFELKNRVGFREIDDSEKLVKPKDGQTCIFEVPAGSQYYCFVVMTIEGTSEEYPCRIIEVDPSSTFEELCKAAEEKVRKTFIKLFGEKNSISLKVFPFSNHFIECFNCGEVRCEKLCKAKSSNKTLSGYLAKHKFIYLKVLVPQPLRANASKLKDFKLLKGNGLTIADCFSAFGLPETLDEKNSWYCPNCKKHVQAIKKMEIFKVPQILIIHLKRFKVTGFFREKINTSVGFPKENLDIQEFVQGNCPGLYDLFAVSNHFGTLAGGHYTATVFNSARSIWYDCNDSSVSEASDISSSASYVLFYKAKSSRKSANSV